MKLKLKKIPSTDLADMYALLLNNGMVKHYRVASYFDKQNALDLITAQVRLDLGQPDTTLELVPSDTKSVVTETARRLAQETFETFLDEDTIETLNAFKSDQPLTQHKRPVNGTGVLPFLSFLAKPLENLKNSVLRWCEGPHMGLSYEEFFAVEFDEVPGFTRQDYKSEFHRSLYKYAARVLNYLIDLIVVRQARTISTSLFYAITCEANQIGEALEELATDLNKSASFIHGTGQPLSLVPLDNTIGVGGSVFALYFRTFFNSVKMDATNMDSILAENNVRYGSQHEGQSTYLYDVPYSQFLLGPVTDVSSGKTGQIYVDDSMPHDGIESKEERAKRRAKEIL